MEADSPAPATPAGRGAIWRRERRGRALVYGPFYRSGYLGAFLVGTLEDGSDLAVVAGSHARHYPYFHPLSKWDDLLVAAGSERLLIAGRRVSSLNIALGPSENATVAYHGRAFRTSGAAVDLNLHLELRATVHHPRAEGLGVRYALLGMQWQPAFVRGSGSVTLEGRRLRIESATGLMERGSLIHLRGRMFQFAFHYLAVARAGGETVYLRFSTAALHRGLAGIPMRLMLAGNVAREELSIGKGRPAPGDREQLAPQPGEATEPVLVHRVDVGPAYLSRELVRIGSGEGRRYGLRQSIDARV
ncbi:MAG: hypothetical protein HY703_13610 [Gemmatimonadetes bacterium]|nr:hypothetical protein [Gemmatimonadota bacterium]